LPPQGKGIRVERVAVGPLMTSLEMAGASLTLLRLTLPPAGAAGASLEALLDAPTAAPGWPGAADISGGGLPPVPAPAAAADAALAAAVRPAVLSPAAASLEAALLAACAALEAAEPQLTAWDAAIGDGDCGETLRAAARALAAGARERFALGDAAMTARQAAHTVRAAVGGTSGGLYDVFLTAAGRSLKAAGAAEPSGEQWAAAFGEGVAAVQFYGGAAAGSRTMLDALLPARDAAAAALASGASGAAALRAAAAAAEAGAEATRAMAAAAGRASYVPAAALAAVPDPGAMAVAIWLSAAAAALGA